MNTFQLIRDTLLNSGDVTAIIGTGTNAKIWNSWPRTYTTPCIVMDLDEEEQQNYLDTGNGDGVIATLTLTCRGNTHDESDALALAVRHSMAGYHGMLLNEQSSLDLIINSIGHSETSKDDGSTAHWYDHILDCTAFWTEPV